MPDKARYHNSEPPTKTTVLIAVHLCPAAPKPAETKAFKVAPTFASGMTIVKFLAPILACKQLSTNQSITTSTISWELVQPYKQMTDLTYLNAFATSRSSFMNVPPSLEIKKSIYEAKNTKPYRGIGNPG